jgi:hypothetical protein
VWYWSGRGRLAIPVFLIVLWRGKKGIVTSLGFNNPSGGGSGIDFNGIFFILVTLVSEGVNGRVTKNLPHHLTD